MPIKPRPRRYYCPKCGWSVMFAPESDVLVEPIPQQCPKCHNPELDSRPANALEKAALKLGEILQPRRL